MRKDIYRILYTPLAMRGFLRHLHGWSSWRDICLPGKPVIPDDVQ
jgi:hypothetical protein